MSPLRDGSSHNKEDSGRPQPPSLRKLAMKSHLKSASTAPTSPELRAHGHGQVPEISRHNYDGSLPPPALAHALRSLNDFDTTVAGRETLAPSTSDTPASRSIPSTAPGSPRIPPLRQNSGSQTPRVRPHATTLNIPGMTRSKVSPDGRISERDVAAKLVIIMVGLPARGKSYITKKVQRYLSWQQHDTRIFNVGNRRRNAAEKLSGLMSPPIAPSAVARVEAPGHDRAQPVNGTKAPRIVVDEPTRLDLNDANAPGQKGLGDQNGPDDQNDPVDQSANFFDPHNAAASKMREQLALDTLDELLEYLLHQGGAVGILDATNSTLHRRQLLVSRIREREPKLGILFLESVCHDEGLLEANMRLKLFGPDYSGKDPMKSLEDFKRRVKAYESAYEPLGPYEEAHDLQYIQMIDVGRKLVNHRIKGFLSGGISSYLTAFNLSPRQIWITRHGQSIDNQLKKIGGDSDLTEKGHCYGESLYNFITYQRKEWLVDQQNKIAQSSFPPKPGDHTPPYPELNRELEEKNFCVWTSMLRRSVETAEYFEADDDYDVKNWESLNELNAGSFEGMTYEEIAKKFPDEFKKRAANKLQYLYPGVGGEGYLSVINRLRDMVREIERITDHLLIIGHRSVCRVLLAYFMDLTREDIADLDMPLGMLYAIEPKPYGFEFHAYRYDEDKRWFDEIPNYKPQRTVDRDN